MSLIRTIDIIMRFVLVQFLIMINLISMVMSIPGGGARLRPLERAHRILGRSLDGLLDQYYWKDQFLAANGWSDDEPVQGRPALESAD